MLPGATRCASLRACPLAFIFRAFGAGIFGQCSRMSDYLNNIVARSLSVAHVVQPRVPHLFEQTVAATPAETEGASTGESVRETMLDSDDPQQASYSQTPSAHVNPPIAISLIEQFQAEPVAPIALPPTPVLPEPPMPLLEATRSHEGPANEPLVAKSVSGQRPATQPRTVNQNAGRVAHSVVPSRVGPTQAQPSATIRKGEPAFDKTNGSISPGVPAALPQLIRAEQQQPSIRISIGRVDVRAIMPAGPAKAAMPARPKPALSLESYLKEREEGKR